MSAEYKSPEFLKAVQEAVSAELAQRTQTSVVPKEFITLDELRVAEFDELSDLALIPVQGTSETVIFRLSDIANYISPNATASIFGLVKISSSLGDAQDTAASIALVKSTKTAIDETVTQLSKDAYRKTGGNISGACSANSFSSRGNVAANGDVSAGGSLTGRSLSVASHVRSALLQSRGDVVAFDPSATRGQSKHLKLERVIGTKPVQELGTLDLIEKVADALDQIVVQLNQQGLDVGFNYDE